MAPFLLEFQSRVHSEQSTKEHISKPVKSLIDFRKTLRYILNLENIKQEDFFEQLLIAKDGLDR